MTPLKLEQILLQPSLFMPGGLNLYASTSILGISGSGKDTHGALAAAGLKKEGITAAHAGSGEIFRMMEEMKFTADNPAMFLLQAEYHRLNSAATQNSGSLLGNDFLFATYAGMLFEQNPDFLINVGFERNFRQVEIPKEFFELVALTAKKQPKLFRKGVLRTAIYLQLPEEECFKRITLRAEQEGRVDDAQPDVVKARIERDRNTIGVVTGALQAYGTSVYTIKCDPEASREDIQRLVFPLVLQAAQIAKGLYR